ncbi:MAG: zf-TFIIB domain-containing protein [Deltaproteobacteria bacterium]|nr:zf-TFIIB domain-containing protein [Deltaproteobacteria bacterium]
MSDVSEKPTRCPCCDSYLDWDQAGEVKLLRCPQCDGFWVARETMAQIEALAMAEAISPPASDVLKEPLGSDARPFLKCPECGELMRRRRYGKRSAVIIDVCSAHGTWLDADELQRLVVFIKDGGFEASVRKERDWLEALLEKEASRMRLDSTRSLNSRDGERQAARNLAEALLPGIYRALG